MRVILTRRRDHRLRYVAVRAPDDATARHLCAHLGTPASGNDSEDGQAGAPLLHGAALGESGCTPERPGAPEPVTGGTAQVGGVPWVVVATGPDAGGAAALRPGRWLTLGREPVCDLTVHDPGLSRRHLRIRQERDGVRIEDLGSTNGYAWESGQTGETWQAGDRLLAGSSTLVLLPRPPAPAHLHPQGGFLEVAPWPRARPELDPVELSTPGPPDRRQVRRPSAWTWTLPLVVAAAVALLLRMPWLLLFGLLGPAMVFGHFLGDRRAARLDHEEALARHDSGLARNRERALEARSAELHRLRDNDPGLVGVVAALTPAPSLALWDAPAGSLRVVLGAHRTASAVRLEGELLEHAAAPLRHDLTAGLVIVGPPEAAAGLARSLLLQLATSHQPDRWSLLIDPLAPPGPGWDLLGWLPHTTVAERPTTGGTAHALRWGVDLLLTDDPARASPARARVVMTGDTEAVLQVPGQQDVPFRPTTLGLARARAAARALAPLRLATTPSTPEVDAARTSPTSVSHSASPAMPTRPTGLGDLGPWPGTVAQVHSAWSRRSLSVPVGIDPHGRPVHLDLARHGPHALVAGTTGSGKSELLRTLVTGLALGSSPAELALLLVDFKGGSSLGDCATLPHVTGLVTDLDPHLAERVLTSLRAELTRRESILATAGVADVGGYAGLPRLVVVIDEFRVLAEEVPEVMAGLVRLAAVGRSLGVHLVLATQRPAGVVGADLRANVNLRIALRVRDAADSQDVIESTAAAQLPEDRPGLALWRTGSEPPRLLQVARAVGPDAHPAEDWAVETFDDVWAARAYLEQDRPTSGGADPTEVFDLLAEAARERGLAPPVVWEPPLPEHIAALPGDERAWALVDRPDRQCREPLVWDAAAHLALVGSARSGRTTALRSLVSRLPPAWLVVLDLGRTLGTTELREHPGVCAWVGPDDLAHGLRVLDHLDRVVRSRTAGADHPPLVLALDGWDRFADLYGELERGRAVEVAHRVLREGPAVGVVAVVTGDRSLLLGRIASLLPQTWSLPLNDPADLLLAGLSTRQVPRDPPPGRIVSVRDGTVAQVVLPAPASEADESTQVKQVKQVTQVTKASESSPGALAAAPAGDPPLLCRELPRRWGPGEAWAVGGDDAGPLAPPAPPVLVLGPPGSGRTTTLHALHTRHAVGANAEALFADGAAPPSIEALRAQLAELTNLALLVVDDAHLLIGTEVEDELVSAVQHRGLGLLVAADLEAASAFRGLVPLAARTRTVVVLQPQRPSDGAVVNVTLPVGDLPVPGRGVLVQRGRCTRLQVGAPPTAPPRNEAPPRDDAAPLA